MMGSDFHVHSKQFPLNNKNFDEFTTSYLEPGFDFFPEKELIDMLKAVEFTLSTNSDIIQAIPTFTGLVDRFRESLSYFFELNSKLKNSLFKLFIQISGPLKNYGLLVNNHELIAVATTNEGILRKMPNTLLITKSRLLLKYATDYSHLLRNSRLNENSIKDFLNVINEFEAFIRFDLIKGNSYESLDLINSLLDLLNNKIDFLVKHLRYTYPKFYNEYSKSRIFSNNRYFKDYNN